MFVRVFARPTRNEATVTAALLSLSQVFPGHRQRDDRQERPPFPPDEMIGTDSVLGDRRSAYDPGIEPNLQGVLLYFAHIIQKLKEPGEGGLREISSLKS